jgi:hypothetical protein
MPEIGIILAKREEISLIEHVFSQGSYLVPDLHYPNPEYVKIRSVDDFLHYRQETRLYFMLHENYAISPLEMRQIEKDGKKSYFIMQRNGGPSIDLFMTAEFVVDDTTKVAPGFVAYYPTFWNTITHQNQKVPSHLLDAHGEIRKYIRSIAASNKLGKRSYWIGREMSRALDDGTMVLSIGNT